MAGGVATSVKNSLSVGGAIHDELSRRKLAESIKEAEASGDNSFENTVRTDALKGALVVRTMMSPLTYAIDFVLGTGKKRDEYDTTDGTPSAQRWELTRHRATTHFCDGGVLGYGAVVPVELTCMAAGIVAGGAVGAAGGLVTAPLAGDVAVYPLTVAGGALAGLAVGTVVPAIPIAVAATALHTVGAAPKAIGSALGASIGGLVGLVHGAIRK